MDTRIQIAVQKSGRLTDHSLDLLTKCGLKYTRSRNQLMYFGENMPIDVLLVRDDDIPELVNEGTCDLGISGQNVTAEKRFGEPDTFLATELMSLDFGHCRLMTAGPEDMEYQGVEQLAGRRIATSYPNILKDYLRNNSVDAEVVTLSGSVEIAPRLGKSDFICDLVSSGATLAANKLRAWDTVFDSEAALLTNRATRNAESQALLDKLVQRISGVLQVKESKYIMLHAPRESLVKVTSLLPGSEFPTILPIEGVDESAVRRYSGKRLRVWKLLAQAPYWYCLLKKCWLELA